MRHPTQANPADTVIDAMKSSIASVARSRECVAAAANQKTSNEHQLGTKSAKIKKSSMYVRPSFPNDLTLIAVRGGCS